MTGLRIASEGYRAHGLGNDYLVFPAAPDGVRLDERTVRALCNRTRGMGSDGIVVLLEREPADGVHPLRMFNPDGSEFERSGNGLRVLGAYLHAEGLVGEGEDFRVRSGGDEIPMTLHSVSSEGILDLSVAMGRAVAGFTRTGLDENELDSARRVKHPDLGPLEFHPVSVGNPHAVLFTSDLSRERLEAVGSFLATHPAFPAGTNVQLARVEGPDHLRIAIWERGVGPTEASGTSSCAVAVAAVDTGRVDPGALRVSMEGGLLSVEVDGDLNVVLRGPVQEVGRVSLAPSWQRWLEAGRSEG